MSRFLRRPEVAVDESEPVKAEEPVVAAEPVAEVVAEPVVEKRRGFRLNPKGEPPENAKVIFCDKLEDAIRELNKSGTSYPAKKLDIEEL